MADERLATLHLTIEYATAKTLNTHKRLQDKDIEWVYEQYRNFFSESAAGQRPCRA